MAVHINLTPNQLDFAQRKGNVSEYIRGLIDKEIREGEKLVPIIEKPPPKPTISERLAELYIQYLKSEEKFVDLNVKTYFRDRDLHLGYFYGLQRERVARYLEIHGTPEILKHYQKIIEIIEKKLEEHETSLVRKEIWSEIEEFVEFRDKMKEILEKPLKEEIYPGWTVEKLLTALEDYYIIDLHTIAGILGITYHQAYNQVLPILRKLKIKYPDLS